MAKPYSQDLRGRLVLAVLSGQSRRNVARSFDVSPSCVIKLMQQWETTGDCLPRKFGGHKRHALAEHEDQVRALVAAQPDLTITALWKKLTALKIKVGRSLDSWALKLAHCGFEVSPRFHGSYAACAVSDRLSVCIKRGRIWARK